jgi:hypothetical protein
MFEVLYSFFWGPKASPVASKLQFLIRIDIQPKMLDPTPGPESMNPDSKHWRKC